MLFFRKRILQLCLNCITTIIDVDQFFVSPIKNNRLGMLCSKVYCLPYNPYCTKLMVLPNMIFSEDLNFLDSMQI